MHKFSFWNIQQRLWDLRDYSVTRETLGAICFIGHVKWRQITQLFSELLHSEPERQGELVTMKPKTFWNRIYTKVTQQNSQKVKKKVFNWSEVHLYRSNFLQNPVHSNPVKKWGKKCSTGQRFICTEVTSYKIHSLKTLHLPFYGISNFLSQKNHVPGFS